MKKHKIYYNKNKNYRNIHNKYYYQSKIINKIMDKVNEINNTIKIKIYHITNDINTLIIL